MADNVEASRLKELRAFLELELQQQDNLVAEIRSLILARLDGLESDLGTKIEQSTNSLAASIGEFEDRFERSRGGKNQCGV